jgi:hypothetical protein
MDRVSIGNARLYGMEDELGMQNNDYLLAVSVLFITYCVRHFRQMTNSQADTNSSSKRPQTQS